MSTAAAVVARPVAPAHRLVVGIGEFAVSNDQRSWIVTHALGSCVAVCIWDPVVSVGGLLHFLLPESKINPARAQAQPAAFADSGIPLLFQAAYGYGLDKKRCIVRLVGGADTTRNTLGSTLNVGRRNILAARNLLWRNGVMVRGEAVGGNDVRTVTLGIADGRVQISLGRELTDEL